MSTEIRPELSKKSEYYIDRERYYELAHFCKQYDLWKKTYRSIDASHSKSIVFNPSKKPQNGGDTLEKMAVAKALLSSKMAMVEEAAHMAGEDLWEYLMYGVTKGLPYDKLHASKGIPCSKGVYYKMYREFFYILDGIRG